VANNAAILRTVEPRWIDRRIYRFVEEAAFAGRKELVNLHWGWYLTDQAEYKKCIQGLFDHLKENGVLPENATVEEPSQVHLPLSTPGPGSEIQPQEPVRAKAEPPVFSQPTSASKAQAGQATTSPKRRKRPRIGTLERVALALYRIETEGVTRKGAARREGTDPDTMNEYEANPYVQTKLQAFRDDPAEASKTRQWLVKLKRR
jgi:hypothetical protein